jgi:hypothetical protein
MRHVCPKCALSYRHAPGLNEHKRVGCRVDSAKGESLIAEDVEEELEQPFGTPSPVETDAASLEFSGYANSPEPEPQE